MRSLSTVAVGLVLAATVAGCDGFPVKPSVTREPVPSVAESAVRANVKNLCDFFYVRAVETLGTPIAEGNVTFLSDQPGVPTSLRTLARDYYDGGYGGRPDTAARRAELNARYASVIKACRAAGWTEP